MPRGAFQDGTYTVLVAESPITISDCPGNASTTSTVELHIVHTWIGDLVVTLIAPDGSSYLLHSRAGGRDRKSVV